MFFDFNENLHIDAHFITDDEYHKTNVFSPPGGTAIVEFIGFQLIFSIFFNMAYIMGPYHDLISMKTINQVLGIREPVAQLFTAVVSC